MTAKTVLITGCSEGGIGAALAQAFHGNGYFVFATLRSVAKAGSLAQLDNVEVLPLEVTSSESIRLAADAVAKRTGGTLDVLVNNAGADFVMPLLDVNIDAAKKLYDVNVWSILATTQVLAPLLIKAKGTILNITSTASCLVLAYAGIYSSSKVAARFLSETLRIELAPLGVRVLTGLIGAVETPIHLKHGEVHLPVGSYYQAVQDIVAKQQQGLLKPGSQPPLVLAKNLVHDVEGGKSGLIWRGGLASVLRLLNGLSASLLEYAVNNDKGLDVVKKAHETAAKQGK